MIATPEPGRVDAERELVADRTDEPAAGNASAKSVGETCRRFARIVPGDNIGHRQPATTVEAYLHDTGDSMERATQALVKARRGITAVGTNLTQAPKTRRSGVVRQSRQNPVKAL